MNAQTTMPFPPPAPMCARPVLVDVNCAALVLKMRPEGLLESVDSGDLIWVFDLARKGAHRRELRFWLGEIMRRQAGLLREPLAVAEALACIVGHPHETHLSTRTVGDTLQTTRTVVHGWLDAGELKGPTPAKGARQQVLRSSLVEFLKRRQVR